ncbi:Glucoside xylosyltransferase 2 [Mactra antiquata]
MIFRSRLKVMLFKLGLTVIILVAVYMYYAINKSNEDDDEPVMLDKHVEVVSDKRPVINDIEKKGIDNVESSILDTSNKRLSLRKESIHLAVVSCGDRMEESLVMLKSAVLFTRSHLVFHVFTEKENIKSFQEQLDFWPPDYQDKFDYEVYSIQFPDSDKFKAEDWKKLFKPCACQRLFLPSILTDIDSILYVDTDVLFLSPVDDIWKLFELFNSTQLAGLAPEHEDKAMGWYNRFARHPYYGELGVNSGVMLMNLTRLRSSPWLISMHNYIIEYKLKITYGDQDLINIYFHYFPEQLYVFGCAMNYRADHCMYMSICKPAEKTGVYVLHGSRRVWFEDKQPAFKAVYNAFKEHRLRGSIKFELLLKLNSLLKKSPESNCGKVSEIFTKQIEMYVNSTSRQP